MQGSGPEAHGSTNKRVIRSKLRVARKIKRRKRKGEAKSMDEMKILGVAAGPSGYWAVYLP